MLWRSTVQRENPASPRGFNPPNPQTQVGDAIFWFNEDQSTVHQPAPTLPDGSISDPNAWVVPISGGNSSDQLNLDQAGTYPYSCVLHSDETGTIEVANAVTIGKTGAGSVAFGPASLPINEGESISWGNSDTESHQPEPDKGTTWLDAPIASGDISALVVVDAGNATSSTPTTFTCTYHCALHPIETGSIVVTIATTGVSAD
jgi:plastocyanin